MTAKKAARRDGPRRKRVTFRFEAGPERNVHLAGSFNNWNSMTHRLNRKTGKGTYSATLPLPVGRYEYKFIVDGVWQCDPACADWALNEHGTLNSVVEVK